MGMLKYAPVSKIQQHFMQAIANGSPGLEY